MAFVTVRDDAMSWEKRQDFSQRRKLSDRVVYAWETKTLFLQTSES